jgi:hypothetical protein
VIDLTFWDGMAAGGAVTALANWLGEVHAKRVARKKNDGMPPCWGCNGLGYNLRPIHERQHAVKVVCAVCDGQRWTTTPKISIHTKPAHK